MKLFFLIALVGWVGYVGYNNIDSLVGGGPEPLHDSAYVVVYGRDTCGITNRLLGDLDRSGVPYEYKRVNDPGVGDELHPRMEASGLNTRRYGLPVVDINAELIIRPDAKAVAEKYRQATRVAKQPDRGSDKSTFAQNRSAVEATKHLSDPLVECRVDGRMTYMLRSQCPE